MLNITHNKTNKADIALGKDTIILDMIALCGTGIALCGTDIIGSILELEQLK